MEDGLAVDDDEVMSTTSQTSVDTRSGDGELLFTLFHVHQICTQIHV